ncbi:unnamed protein product [Tetraodon nigroviridis]|uniref:(spotted green pufferfish) hypothetical protein n=1 Tax=Tetraodon nigroviridis TaxID=99883 RepID=Q4S2Q7_TETNG|nr:unnamed protein product [Tetraodon nigroviridis]
MRNANECSRCPLSGTVSVWGGGQWAGWGTKAEQGGLIGVCIVAKRGVRVYWRMDNEPWPAVKGPFCGSLLAVYYPWSPGGC